MAEESEEGERIEVCPEKLMGDQVIQRLVRNCEDFRLNQVGEGRKGKGMKKEIKMCYMCVSSHRNTNIMYYTRTHKLKRIHTLDNMGGKNKWI